MNAGVPRLERSRAALLVIDIQEKLVPAMEAELKARLLGSVRLWGQAAKVLALPVVMTEQYPKGLGPTIPDVRAAFSEVTPRSKLCFDALGDPANAEMLGSCAQVVVMGMETHICVFQTVRSLVQRGKQVHVLRDAVASRTVENYQVGLELCRAAGAIISSTEAALFDLLGEAGTDEFRALSKLVR